MFAGQLLSAPKMMICGRFTIHTPHPPAPSPTRGEGELHLAGSVVTCCFSQGSSLILYFLVLFQLILRKIFSSGQALQGRDTMSPETTKLSGGGGPLGRP